jgi:alkanesulfonate monooxygenase SsuD/methylene tetrahydromethanopterin reductase-like flavin-dependent oxidoreductase (luciferase family)
MAMASVHYAYDNWRQLGRTPPSYLEDIWEDYSALLAQVPEARLHQRIHAGHNCWVVPEEEKFLTREVLAATCLIGTAEAIAERLSSIGEAGLDQIMILPAWEPRYEVLERTAKQLGPLLA